MTVADNTSRNQYTATSGQTVFAYTFEIVDKDDIVVLKNGTTLSEGTDYTVSNVGNDNGGNVTLTVGATAGDILTLYRDMPYARTQNYTNSGDFLASEVNSDFDNLWLAGEQTNRSFSQSIRKPITDSDSISMELPEAANRTNSFLTFDSTGAVSVESLSSANAPSNVGRQQFTGNGSTTVFALAAEAGSGAGVFIYIDGVYQESDTYTISGKTLTFTEAPPVNASIEVVSYRTGDINTADANAVTYTPAGTGAVQTTVQAKLRESVSVKDFGAVGDGVTDDTTAIQAAIDSLGNDGGTILFPEGVYVISATLNLTKKTHLIGDGGYFLNQFTDNTYTVGGTTIKLKTGSNTDMLKVQLDSASTGDDYRSHCSIRNIHFFGNRSDAQSPATRDNNTSGNGIVISGVRYVTLENVIVTKCAEDGVVIQSHDYGSGAKSSNNLDIRGCAFHSNYGRGILAAGGDNIMLGCTIGYNGNSGISASGFGLINNCLVWDNLGAGVFVASTTETPVLVGNKIYDNDLSGINIGSTDGHAVITGNMILRNGGGTTSGAENKSGIYIASTRTSGIIISGNEIGNNTGTSQEYGVYFNSSATRVEGFAGNNIYGNATANITLATTDNIRLHENIGTSTPKHPGFVAEGDIDLNGNNLSGFELRSSPDASSASVVITTSPVTLFSGATNGAVYMVFITHIAGNAGGWAVISGDTSTPLITTQDSTGSPTYTFSISGTSIAVATSSSSLTSTWKMYRVV